jgi:hypothetical protein
MHAVASPPHIAAAAGLDRLPFGAAAENVPEKSVAAVESDAMGALQPRHPRHQVRVESLQHQVIVVAHQAIGMHLPARLLARFGQCP